MTTPLLSQAEAQSHDTFVALMWTLTHPGQIQTWTTQNVTTQDGFFAIGQALLDLETGFYTPDAALAEELVRTTARPLPANTARYHFYPNLNSAALNDITQAPVGTMLYPDRGATIVISCALGTGATYCLTGPGIKSESVISIDGLPLEFLQLRQENISYPLGWDIFLVDKSQLIGLPRTTNVVKG